MSDTNGDNELTQNAAGALGRIRSCLGSLITIGLVFRVLAIVLLVPLLSGVVRLAFLFSGKSVVADFDIVLFLIGPVGALCILAIATIRLGFLSIELAGYLGVLDADAHNERPTLVDVLRFAFGSANPLLRFTAKAILKLVILVIPFVILLLLVYWIFVSKHDINYYMANRPTEWIVAIMLGGALGVGYTVLAIFELANWFLVLPLMLAHQTTPVQAMLQSKSLMGDRRKTILQLIALLFVFVLLNALTLLFVLKCGTLLLSFFGGSLGWIILVTGVILLMWFALSEFLNISGKAYVAAMMHSHYDQLTASHPELRRETAFVVGAAGTKNWLKNRKSILAAASLALIIAAVVGVLFAKSIVVEDQCVIHAHRGASGTAPENTLAAIQAAIDQKADFVEIDVQEIKNGEVVVFHDSDFMRQAKVPLNIWDATPDDIEKIEIGSWFAAKYEDQRAPRLSDVLKLCKGKIKVNIELKYYGHDEKLEERVVELVEAHEMEKDVVVMSLKKKGVEKMRRLRPDWTVGLLTAVAIGDLTSVDVDFLAVRADLANRDFVKAAHKSGKFVLVWTVNDPVSISRMVSRGVDGVITDEPGIARSILETRANLSPAERLILEVAEYFGISDQILEQ